MLEYRVKSELNPLESVLSNVLKEREMSHESVNVLLNLPKYALIDWRNLNNINKGVDLYLKHINDRNKVGLLVDVDTDGFCSAVEMYNYTKNIDKTADIKVYINKGKTHGLNEALLRECKKDKVKLLILPDSSSNDIEFHEKFANCDIELLIIDHHEIEKELPQNDKLVLINTNDSPQYTNKSISASGVVYKFLQALDSRLNLNYADDYLDLAGLGCIADVMSAKEHDTRYLMNCVTEVNNLKNPLLKQIIEDNILKYNVLTGESLAWQVAPKINALCRMGSVADKKLVFEGFVNDDFISRDNAIKKINSVKSKQDRTKKKAIPKVIEYIEKNNLMRYPLMIIDTTQLFAEPELNGVVASYITGELNRSVILVCGEGEVLSGSARGSETCLIKNLKSWCLETGLFEFCAGHGNAHGSAIKRENIQVAMEQSLKDFGECEGGSKVILVDYEIDFKDLNKQDILEIGSLEKLWVTNIKKPVFAIRNVPVIASDIQKLGSRGNVLRFQVNGVSFIKTYLSKEFFSRITLEEITTFGTKNLNIDIIGTFSKNTYGDNETPQIDIIEAESTIVVMSKQAKAKTKATVEPSASVSKDALQQSGTVLLDEYQEPLW